MTEQHASRCVYGEKEGWGGLWGTGEGVPQLCWGLDAQNLPEDQLWQTFPGQLPLALEPAAIG